MKTEHAAELHPAYVWDCDACGRENFERATLRELSDEERRELYEEHDIEPPFGCHFQTCPDFVKCKHCDATFVAKDIHEQ